MTKSIIITVLLCMAGTASADPVTFNTHIRKIFRDNCSNCHNASRPRAGLDLTSYAATMKGSTSGEVLVPGQPEDSFLYLSITHAEEPAMPPGKARMKQTILDQMKTWIEIGMPEKPEDITTAALPAGGKTQPELDTANGDSTPAPSASGGFHDIVLAGKNGNPITALAVSPDGRLAAVGGQLQVVLFDLTKHEFAGTLAYPEGEIFALKFSSDGTRLIAAGGTAAESGNVVIWSTRSGSRTNVVGDEYDVALAADISPDSNLILYGGPDRILRIADLSSRKMIAQLEKHTDWVTSASFSPDGLIFTTADRDGNAYVWETQSQAQVHTLRGHRGAITSIQWASGGDLCLTSSEDGTVRVWDMHSGRALREWIAHQDGALSMQVSSAEEIVTAGRDGFVRRWSIEGLPLAEVKPDSIPTQVAIAGDAIVTGHWNGSVSVWKPNDEKLLTLTVPQSRITDDPAPMLAEITGPPPITELAVATEPQVGAVAAAMEASTASDDLEARLLRARDSLMEVRIQITQRRSEPADASLLLQTLTDASQIAQDIDQPSSEIIEAQVFLKAAVERARSAAATPKAAQTGVRSFGHEIHRQLTSVNQELTAIAAECQKYVSLAEQVTVLAELSAQLRMQLTSHGAASTAETEAQSSVETGDR